MKYVVILITIFSCVYSFPQEKAIEIYLRKKPSKNLIIEIDDKVLIKCRHLQQGYKKMVPARLGKIDGIKFYFYPIDKQYRESIYTLSTLNEVGIITPSRKALFILDYTRSILAVFKKDYRILYEDEHITYKVINVKSRKWEVKLIDN